MYLLSIEASTKFSSVALHHNGEEVFAVNNFTEKSASSTLTVLVQTAVDAVGIALSDVSAIAVAKGPGSYTGLRVAVSVAKGLCFALDKPLIGINTLEAMAWQVRRNVKAAGTLASTGDLLFVPMIDARRMEVYCALYDEDGKTVEATHPLIVTEDSFDSWMTNHRLVFFGDGAPKCQALFPDNAHAIFWKEIIHPQANAVGALAWTKFQTNDVEDLAGFEPFYLKEFMIGKPSGS